MVRRGGMRTQMAKQMGVSKNKADDLLVKAKKMNDAEGFNIGGTKMAKEIPAGPKGAGLRALKKEAPGVVKNMGFKRGGSLMIMITGNVSRETFNPVEEITPGPKDIKVEMNRQVRNQEIKGTPPVQVKGRKFSGVY